MVMKVLLVNGPNLQLLGVREPGIYGGDTLPEIVGRVCSLGKELGAEVTAFQSNHEGALVDKIQEAFGVFDGIVINPGAYTHTSIALLDAVKAVGIPTVEVHISDVSKREDFRQISYIRLGCVASVIGKGTDGYLEAMDILLERSKNR